jgi:hypothetical protein
VTESTLEINKQPRAKETYPSVVRHLVLVNKSRQDLCFSLQIAAGILSWPQEISS